MAPAVLTPSEVLHSAFSFDRNGQGWAEVVLRLAHAASLISGSNSAGACGHEGTPTDFATHTTLHF